MVLVPMVSKLLLLIASKYLYLFLIFVKLSPFLVSRFGVAILFR